MYLFSHHHHADVLVAKYFDEVSQDATLFCRDTVVDYYGALAKNGSKVHTFRFPRRLFLLPLRIAAELPFRFCRRPVDLICVHPLGLQVLLALSRYRVSRIVYVHRIDQHLKIPMIPPNLAWRLYLIVVSLLLGRPVSLMRWGSSVEFSISDGAFEPPVAPQRGVALVDHDLDLVILDFAVDSLPIDHDASLRRVREFVGRFQKAAVKVHPNHPGNAAAWLSLPELPGAVPAEAYATRNTHCLTLVSAADHAFGHVTNLLSLVEFNSPSERRAWEAFVRQRYVDMGRLDVFERGMRAS